MANRNTKKTLEVEEETSPGIGMLYGGVDPMIVQDLTVWILSENISTNPPPVLNLMINSSGGELASAFALIEVMRGSKIPIRTIGLGELSSAGLFIFMAAKKGYRVLTPSCSIMSHHFTAGSSGTYHQLMTIQKEYTFTDQRIVEHYKLCTGLDEKTIRERLLPEQDVYLSPSDALELGLADEVRGMTM
jgi:ATP-dependent protease ClpP protease subunit